MNDLAFRLFLTSVLFLFFGLFMGLTTIGKEKLQKIAIRISIVSSIGVCISILIGIWTA